MSTNNMQSGLANKKFIRNMVETASPMQLIILLYDGALQWLVMAKQELKKNNETNLPNWSNYANFMGKAHDIVTHLQDSLDHSQAPEFSDKIFDLYDFIKSSISKASAFKKEADLDNAYKLLKDLKTTWKEAYDNQKIS
jgi:flagellar protein FliS